jgi:ApbE superfamily uncharacterized protein (UPF0280 family)
MRTFTRFSYRKADYRIASAHLNTVTDIIINQREILEKFIIENKVFLKSLTPIPALTEYSPDIAKIMQKAASITNVGPMAAVAGTIAQLAAEKGAFGGDGGRLGESESIVENGGDIYMILKNKLVLGIHSGVESLEGKLAFLIKPKETPLAVCSSSSTMGHSFSLGDCNLVTVFSKSGALADAAATRACNLVKKTEDVEKALNEISVIPGILGLMIIKGENIGMAGNLPEIISNADPDMLNKITQYK